MAAWCLTKDAEARLLEALRKDGDPQKMVDRGTEGRQKWFSQFGEENAKNLNALFESKMLLKSQQKGFQSFVKNLGGSKQIRTDFLSKVDRLETALSKSEVEQYLGDYTTKRLGLEAVTEEEFAAITKLSNKVKDLQAKTDITKSDVPLGRAKLDVLDYVNSFNKKSADLVTNIAGVPRTAMTSFDLSAPLNQGWGMVSRRRFYTSLATMFKSAGSKNAFRDLQAEIITHPKYDLAKKAGLRLTDLGSKLEFREEAFMSTLLDKVPGISHSQRAYTAFLNKLRMDSFSDLVKKAEVAGENVTSGAKATEDLAKVVNNFTGGARVGKVEGAVPLLNAVFFSPRKITSTLQMFNPSNYINPKISKTARLEATRNLIGSLALSAGVISLYSLLTGKKQESDPTSSDFGKIRSGDTRLDVSGGNATYLNILSRIITQKIKSASGASRDLGTGYGETSGFDLIAQFIRYKLSPNASFLIDAITGENAIGEKKTISESAIDRFKPMFGDSVVELLKSDTDGKFGFALTALFGAGLNTYSNSVDWGENKGKEITQFKQKVGEDKFKQANNDFNNQYNTWFDEKSQTADYKNLSNEAKKKVITATKAKLQEKIFKQYNFTYRQEPKTHDEIKESKVAKSLQPK